MNSLIPVGAIILGGAIGYSFGAIQTAALLKNKKHQEAGTLTNGWSIMPNSLGRVSVLILTLVVVQIACPLFFEGVATPWLVSGGVVVGYGWTLIRQLRDRTIYRG